MVIGSRFVDEDQEYTSLLRKWGIQFFRMILRPILGKTVHDPTSGFVGVGTPDELLIALAKRYQETRHPSDLTLVFAAAPGDSKERGLNRLALDGLVKRAVGGHWALVPKLGELALAALARPEWAAITAADSCGGTWPSSLTTISTSGGSSGSRSNLASRVAIGR